MRDLEQKIIVVNDGSTGKSLDIFNRIDTHQNQVEILHHAVNLGKGQALKTAFNHFLLHFGNAHPGLVTADADGQHLVDDILRVSKALAENPTALSLGCRGLEKDVPLRSLLGNKLTILVFKLVTGQTVTDTQTGLRGIPTNFLRDLLRTQETGYDFEQSMLVQAVKSGYTIIEVPIQTVYMANNKSSHFNYIRDSLKIYFVFLRFSMISLATAGLDYITFAIGYQFSQNIFLSLIAARIVGGSFQFAMGKAVVFKSKNNALFEAFKYALLVLVLMMLSYGLIVLQVSYLKISPYLAKILAESAVFVLSFTAQNFIVYARKPHKLNQP